MKQTALFKIIFTISLATILIILIQAQTSESFAQKTARAEALNNQAVDLIDSGVI